ncbi:MAG: NADH-quinone oxidoreductase subunit H [Spirochaetes bacterium]|nr:NADH-quinone oxidoreductase subunit H [Spirochaetota bacterium]
MEIFINLIIIIIMPFLFIGMINRTKALWAGKRGVPLFQFLYDFIKLLKKGQVISNTTSFVFQMMSVIYLASVIFACSLIPMVNHRAFFSFPGDFILFAYILGLGKFFTVISAMDTGSSFEGMGANREATFSIFVEPVFFVIISSFALITRNITFISIFTSLDNHGWIIMLIKFLTAAAFFEMILVEGSRVPVDDPNTHLELTMIHEVMILDNSGPDLAFIQYGTGLKMTAFSILIANILIPKNINILYSILSITGILLVIAVMIGLTESLIARYKLSRVPQFLFFMSSLSLIIFSLILFFIKGISL